MGLLFDLRSAYVSKVEKTIEKSEKQADFEDAYYQDGVIDYLEYKVREKKMELSEIKLIYKIPEKSELIQNLKEVSKKQDNSIKSDALKKIISFLEEKIAAFEIKNNKKENKTWGDVIADKIANSIIKRSSVLLEKQREMSLKKIYSKRESEYANQIYIFIMENKLINKKFYICCFGSLFEIKREEKEKNMYSRAMLYWLICVYFLYYLCHENLIGFDLIS